MPAELGDVVTVSDFCGLMTIGENVVVLVEELLEELC